MRSKKPALLLLRLQPMKLNHTGSMYAFPLADL